MLEGFERFTRAGRSFKPRLSIRKRGQIGFNSAAIDKFNLRKYEYVVLFISEDRKKVAVVFSNNKSDEGAIKLIKGKNNFAFSAQAFLECYEIPYGKAKTYDVEWNQKEQAAIVDISQSSVGKDGN